MNCLARKQCFVVPAQNPYAIDGAAAVVTADGGGTFVSNLPVSDECSAALAISMLPESVSILSGNDVPLSRKIVLSRGVAWLSFFGLNRDRTTNHLKSGRA